MSEFTCPVCGQPPNYSGPGETPCESCGHPNAAHCDDCGACVADDLGQRAPFDPRGPGPGPGPGSSEDGFCMCEGGVLPPKEGADIHDPRYLDHENPSREDVCASCPHSLFQHGFSGNSRKCVIYGCQCQNFRKQAEFSPGDTSSPLAERATPNFNPPTPRGKDPWLDVGDVGLPENNSELAKKLRKKLIPGEQMAGPTRPNYPGNGLMSEAARGLNWPDDHLKGVDNDADAEDHIFAPVSEGGHDLSGDDAYSMINGNYLEGFDDLHCMIHADGIRHPHDPRGPGWKSEAGVLGDGPGRCDFCHNDRDQTRSCLGCWQRICPDCVTQHDACPLCGDDNAFLSLRDPTDPRGMEFDAAFDLREHLLRDHEGVEGFLYDPRGADERQMNFEHAPLDIIEEHHREVHRGLDAGALNLLAVRHTHSKYGEGLEFEAGTPKTLYRPRCPNCGVGGQTHGSMGVDTKHFEKFPGSEGLDDPRTDHLHLFSAWGHKDGCPNIELPDLPGRYGHWLSAYTPGCFDCDDIGPGHPEYEQHIKRYFNGVDPWAKQAAGWAKVSQVKVRQAPSADDLVSHLIIWHGLSPGAVMGMSHVWRHNRSGRAYWGPADGEMIHETAHKFGGVDDILPPEYPHTHSPDPRYPDMQGPPVKTGTVEPEVCGHPVRGKWRNDPRGDLDGHYVTWCTKPATHWYRWPTEPEWEGICDEHFERGMYRGPTPTNPWISTDVNPHLVTSAANRDESGFNPLYTSCPKCRGWGKGDNDPRFDKSPCRNCRGYGGFCSGCGTPCSLLEDPHEDCLRAVGVSPRDYHVFIEYHGKPGTLNIQAFNPEHARQIVNHEYGGEDWYLKGVRERKTAQSWDQASDHDIPSSNQGADSIDPRTHQADDTRLMIRPKLKQKQVERFLQDGTYPGNKTSPNHTQGDQYNTMQMEQVVGGWRKPAAGTMDDSKCLRCHKPIHYDKDNEAWYTHHAGDPRFYKDELANNSDYFMCPDGKGDWDYHEPDLLGDLADYHRIHQGGWEPTNIDATCRRCGFPIHYSRDGEGWYSGSWGDPRFSDDDESTPFMCVDDNDEWGNHQPSRTGARAPIDKRRFFQNPDEICPNCYHELEKHRPLNEWDSTRICTDGESYRGEEGDIGWQGCRCNDVGGPGDPRYAARVLRPFEDMTDAEQTKHLHKDHKYSNTDAYWSDARDHFGNHHSPDAEDLDHTHEGMASHGTWFRNDPRYAHEGGPPVEHPKSLEKAIGEFRKHMDDEHPDWPEATGPPEDTDEIPVGDLLHTHMMMHNSASPRPDKSDPRNDRRYYTDHIPHKHTPDPRTGQLPFDELEDRLNHDEHTYMVHMNPYDTKGVMTHEPELGDAIDEALDYHDTAGNKGMFIDRDELDKMDPAERREQEEYGEIEYGGNTGLAYNGSEVHARPVTDEEKKRYAGLKPGYEWIGEFNAGPMNLNPLPAATPKTGQTVRDEGDPRGEEGQDAAVCKNCGRDIYQFHPGWARPGRDPHWWHTHNQNANCQRSDLERHQTDPRFDRNPRLLDDPYWFLTMAEPLTKKAQSKHAGADTDRLMGHLGDEHGVDEESLLWAIVSDPMKNIIHIDDEIAAEHLMAHSPAYIQDHKHPNENDPRYKPGYVTKTAQFGGPPGCQCLGRGLCDICIAAKSGDPRYHPQAMRPCDSCKGSGLCQTCEGWGVSQWSGDENDPPDEPDFCPDCDREGSYSVPYSRKGIIGMCKTCHGGGVNMEDVLAAERAAQYVNKKTSMDLSWGGYDPVRSVSPSSDSAPAPSAQGSGGDPWVDLGDNGTAPPRPGYIRDKKLKKWVKDTETWPESGPLFGDAGSDANKIGATVSDPYEGAVLCTRCIGDGDVLSDDGDPRYDPDQGDYKPCPACKGWGFVPHEFEKQDDVDWCARCGWATTQGPHRQKTASSTDAKCINCGKPVDLDRDGDWIHPNPAYTQFGGHYTCDPEASRHDSTVAWGKGPELPPLSSMGFNERTDHLIEHIGGEDAAAGMEPIKDWNNAYDIHRQTHNRMKEYAGHSHTPDPRYATVRACVDCGETQDLHLSADGQYHCNNSDDCYARTQGQDPPEADNPVEEDDPADLPSHLMDEHDVLPEDMQQWEDDDPAALSKAHDALHGDVFGDSQTHYHVKAAAKDDLAPLGSMDFWNKATHLMHVHKWPQQFLLEADNAALDDAHTREHLDMSSAIKPHTHNPDPRYAGTDPNDLGEFIWEPEFTAKPFEAMTLDERREHAQHHHSWGLVIGDDRNIVEHEKDHKATPTSFRHDHTPDPRYAANQGDPVFPPFDSMTEEEQRDHGVGVHDWHPNNVFGKDVIKDMGSYTDSDWEAHNGEHNADPGFFSPPYTMVIHHTHKPDPRYAGLTDADHREHDEPDLDCSKCIQKLNETGPTWVIRPPEVPYRGPKGPRGRTGAKKKTWMFESEGPGYIEPRPDWSKDPCEMCGGSGKQVGDARTPNDPRGPDMQPQRSICESCDGSGKFEDSIAKSFPLYENHGEVREYRPADRPGTMWSLEVEAEDRKAAHKKFKAASQDYNDYINGTGNYEGNDPIDPTTGPDPRYGSANPQDADYACPGCGSTKYPPMMYFSPEWNKEGDPRKEYIEKKTGYACGDCGHKILVKGHLGSAEQCYAYTQARDAHDPRGPGGLTCRQPVVGYQRLWNSNIDGPITWEWKPYCAKHYQEQKNAWEGMVPADNWKSAQVLPQSVGDHDADNGIEDPMKRGDKGKTKKIYPGTQKADPTGGEWNISVDNLNKTSKTPKCGLCGGTGVYENTNGDPRYDYRDSGGHRMQECPICHFTGFAPHAAVPEPQSPQAPKGAPVWCQVCAFQVENPVHDLSKVAARSWDDPRGMEPWEGSSLSAKMKHYREFHPDFFASDVADEAIADLVHSEDHEVPGPRVDHVHANPSAKTATAYMRSGVGEMWHAVDDNLTHSYCGAKLPEAGTGDEIQFDRPNSDVLCPECHRRHDQEEIQHLRDFRENAEHKTASDDNDDDDLEYYSRCPACGDPSDYCRGGGPESEHERILALHDSGFHDECAIDGCDERQEQGAERGPSDPRGPGTKGSKCDKCKGYGRLPYEEGDPRAGNWFDDYLPGEGTEFVRDCPKCKGTGFKRHAAGEDTDLLLHLIRNHGFPPPPDEDSIPPLLELQQEHEELHMAGENDHNPEVLKVAHEGWKPTNDPRYDQERESFEDKDTRAPHDPRGPNFEPGNTWNHGGAWQVELSKRDGSHPSLDEVKRVHGDESWEEEPKGIGIFGIPLPPEREHEMIDSGYVDYWHGDHHVQGEMP